MFLSKGLQPHCYVRGRQSQVFEVLGREEDSQPLRGLALAHSGAPWHHGRAAALLGAEPVGNGTKSNLGLTKVWLNALSGSSQRQRARAGQAYSAPSPKRSLILLLPTAQGPPEPAGGSACSAMLRGLLPHQHARAPLAGAQMVSAVRDECCRCTATSSPQAVACRGTQRLREEKHKSPFFSQAQHRARGWSRSFCTWWEQKPQKSALKAFKSGLVFLDGNFGWRGKERQVQTATAGSERYESTEQRLPLWLTLKSRRWSPERVWVGELRATAAELFPAVTNFSACRKPPVPLSFLPICI